MLQANIGGQPVDSQVLTLLESNPLFAPIIQDLKTEQSLDIQSLSEEPNDAYFSSADYVSKMADDKMGLLWSKITKDTTPGTFPSTLELSEIFLESMMPTFQSPGDGMIYRDLIRGYRKKLIHSVGVVGKVKFNAVDNKYDGLFKGADNGIIRFSCAVKPDEKSQPLPPGLGLKFLRDQKDSANLVAMYSVDGQPDDWNFFSNDWSNWIPTPQGTATKTLAAKFATATDMIQTVGLSDFAEGGEFPFKLRFSPSSDVHSLFPTEFQGDAMAYVQQLQTVPADSNLYDVYAWDGPEQLGGTEALIGTLQLEGTMTSSKWGDEHLFFRHQLMDDDVKIHPEWAEYIPSYKNGGKCPYQSMLQALQLL